MEKSKVNDFVENSKVFAWILLCGGLIGMGILFFQVKNGVISAPKFRSNWGDFTFLRSEEPVYFWLSVLVYAMVSGIFIFQGLKVIQKKGRN